MVKYILLVASLLFTHTNILAMQDEIDSDSLRDLNALLSEFINKLDHSPEPVKSPFDTTYPSIAPESYKITLKRTNHFSKPRPQDAPTFFCSKCSRIYVTTEMIKKHQIWHLKFKPCTYCNKEFCTQRELQNHIARKHLCKEWLDCLLCENTYTTKSSLDLHILRKHQEKRFECNKCAKKFAIPGDLTQHNKRAH